MVGTPRGFCPQKRPAGLIPEQEVDSPASPAVSHLRRSAAALRSRPPPPWPGACAPAAAPLQPGPGARHRRRGPRDSPGWAPSAVRPGSPHARYPHAALARPPRPAPRPPPSAPSGGTPRAATSGSRAPRRLQGAMDAAVGSWLLPCLKVGGVSRFSLFSGIDRVPDYKSEDFQN